MNQFMNLFFNFFFRCLFFVNLWIVNFNFPIFFEVIVDFSLKWLYNFFLNLIIYGFFTNFTWMHTRILTFLIFIFLKLLSFFWNSIIIFKFRKLVLFLTRVNATVGFVIVVIDLNIISFFIIKLFLQLFNNHLPVSINFNFVRS